MANCCEVGKPAPDSYVPAGNFTAIESAKVYATGDPAAAQGQGLLLLLPDGFGVAHHNLRLADYFAKEGWYVIVPDYYEGDPVPIQFLKRNNSVSVDDEPWPEEEKLKLRNFDFPAWLKLHNHPHVSSILEHLVTDILKRHPNANMFGVGYCFGGKHVIRLAKSHLKAAAAFHPSFVDADDIVGVRAPLYVGLAEQDDMVSPSLADDLRAWTASSIEGYVTFILEIYPSVGHGFASRPDAADPLIIAQYQRAFQKTLEHLSSCVNV